MIERRRGGGGRKERESLRERERERKREREVTIFRVSQLSAYCGIQLEAYMHGDLL